MKNHDNHSALGLPCLRGQVQDWIYYVTLMPFREIASRFKPAEEIHKHKTLNELLQRALNRRSAEIGDYILNQRQHFFNAVIAGVYEGEPRWVEIDLRDKNALDEKSSALIQDSIGVLELSGQEKIFAIDGQHRVEGIKGALSQTSKHDDEECAVIFVAHSGTKSGLERTRRLFSTLNRYAKPVKLGEIIALDEDDSIAVITRRLLYHGPHLDKKDAIIAAKTKNLVATDRVSWTSVQALYDFIERVLLYGQGWKKKQIDKFKMLRRSNDELDGLYAEISLVIEAMVKWFPELENYFSNSGKADASKFRGGKDGGSLLFRPIGLSVIGDCLAYCKTKGVSPAGAIKQLRLVDRTLSSELWSGLLFDSANSKMRRATKGELTCATLLWLQASGLLDREDFPKLVKSFSEAHEVEAPEAKRAISKLIGK